MYNTDTEENYKAKQRTKWDRKSEVIKMKTRAINLTVENYSIQRTWSL